MVLTTAHIPIDDLQDVPSSLNEVHPIGSLGDNLVEGNNLLRRSEYGPVRISHHTPLHAASPYPNGIVDGRVIYDPYYGILDSQEKIEIETYTKRQQQLINYMKDKYGTFPPKTRVISNNKTMMLNVWRSNLRLVFPRIRRLLADGFTFIAMDTEFPGTVCRLRNALSANSSKEYSQIKCNVDLTKIIQVGMTFFNEKGELPPNGVSTYQFNFHFSLKNDMSARDSMVLLEQAGINFDRLEIEGIDAEEFSNYLIISKLVFSPEVTWIGFHASADFAYLLRLITGRPLPLHDLDFISFLPVYFNVIYDVKFLMRSCKNLKGGLEELAYNMDVPREGVGHQAGSDSLLTGRVFFKMRRKYFESCFDERFMNKIYGISPAIDIVYSPMNDETEVRILPILDYNETISNEVTNSSSTATIQQTESINQNLAHQTAKEAEIIFEQLTGGGPVENVMSNPINENELLVCDIQSTSADISNTFPVCPNNETLVDHGLHLSEDGDAIIANKWIKKDKD
ncbi:hypothetical protein SNEBB_008943 [Seison nebaliae]|nr:hypothetical protein SNEBB_008943 [Seison nebaliae]